MKHLFTAFFVFLFISLNAQNKSKEHFIIHKIDNSVNVEKYQLAAAEWGKLDEFRFYDQRRTIYFTDMKASIELFSAKELYVMYGKEISPNTIKSNDFPLVTFDITMDGKGLKPQLVRK